MSQAMAKVESATSPEDSRLNTGWKLRLLLRFVSLTLLDHISLGALADHDIVDGVLSFCVISLAVKVPRIAEASTQRVAVFAWGAVIFLMYSFLLSVFRVKNGGYPFSLPPFM